MATHMERMERFENAIFKQREEINDRMVEMFGLLKEVATSRTLEKVIVREEVRHPITKHVNSISLIRIGEEKSVINNGVVGKNIVEPNKSIVAETLEEVDRDDEVTNRTNNELVRSVEKDLTGEKLRELVETSRSQPVKFYLKHKIDKDLIEGLVGNQRFNDSLLAMQSGKMECEAYHSLPVGPMRKAMLKKMITKKMIWGLTNKKLVETDIRLSLASQSHIQPLGTYEDVLVEIATFIYLKDLVILDIKEDRRKPFILGILFLKTAKAEIRACGSVFWKFGTVFKFCLMLLDLSLNFENEYVALTATQLEYGGDTIDLSCMVEFKRISLTGFRIYTSRSHYQSVSKQTTRHKYTQVYGTILPKELTNQAMLESNAYKTYYIFASGEKTPKLKYIQKKANPNTSPKQKLVQATKCIKLKSKAKVAKLDKKKQPAKKTKAKGLTILSEVMELVLYQGFSLYLYTNLKVRKSDDINDGNGDDDDNANDDDKQEGDDTIDDDEETDSDRTESDRIKIPIFDQSTTEYYEEEEQKIDDEETMDEEEDNEVTKEMCDDLNVNSRNKDTEKTNTDQGASEQQNVSQDSGFEQVEEDTHVTLTPVLDT
ncbi:hypothetical protein Tco_0649624 [Tanacetum coccineum]